MFKFRKKETLNDYELIYSTLRIEDYLNFISSTDDLLKEDKENIFAYLEKYIGKNKYINLYALNSNKNKMVLIVNKDKTIIEKINLERRN